MLRCGWFAVAVLATACGTSPFGLRARSDGGPTGPTGPTGSNSGRYHPEGWAAPSAHGTALKKQQEDCRGCHGADLAGGTVSVSCDGCHPAGWRTDCTFCHGGVDDSTGAPPRDLLGATSGLSFNAHGVHVSARPNHAAFDCTQCHVKPADVLSAGHVFDGTPNAKAEVSFSAGLSNQATYANGTCSQLYCHGDGRGHNGTYQVTGPPTTCHSCHGDAVGGTLSGQHREHLREGVRCSDCHGRVASSHTAIATAALHVNGTVEVDFPPNSITRSGGRCTGLCHFRLHFNESW